ncbi:hypothetical protein [Rhodobacter sp. TJ_12]|uniref:hypothetical protein n=1 Tax=Rhodobacter sp. TJ_12 TaxID=2029399 RepID=UPI001CBCA0EA|nr:hypothetical protein [Rhodobacter sp. TJ_12]
MKFQQVYYVVDAQFRILWIGGEWDDFALANGGAAARANTVLSSDLLAHVSGASTRTALAEMIGAVRETQRPARLDYRCDSPQMLRRFQLSIQPMKDGRVLMVHDLRDARAFDAPLPPWRADPAAKAQKCSFCGAVHRLGGTKGKGQWDFAEDLGARHPQCVTYVICPGCAAQIAEVIDRLHQERAPDPAATGGFGPPDDA